MLFTSQDIKTMFSMFDITNSGYISKQQYLKGMIVAKGLTKEINIIHLGLEYIGSSNLETSIDIIEKIDLSNYERKMYD